ncbi:MAG: universal stress protein UspA [Chitinophagales bacterium]|nr:MAG: universal stress protein UspA [Chitinophagales bacterium]
MRLKFKKILVPTDFSQLSLNALNYAGTLARLTEAEISLLHVLELYELHSHLSEILDMKKVVEKAVSEKLTQIQKENASLLGVKIKAHVVSGNVTEEIQKFAKEQKTDLIVMGTHGVRGITEVNRYLLGSTAYRLVHLSECPVITIREPQKKPQFKTIVLPLDTTKETTQKVKYAMGFAKLFASTVHVISVSTFFEEFRYNLSELKLQLNKVTDQLIKENIDVKTQMIRHEDVADSVMEYARKVKADLIIIMVREESINEAILGSRAKKIITRSSIPVLSLRPAKAK